MTNIILFYLFLISLWAENVLGFQLTKIQGFSLQNVLFYLLVISWVLSIISKKKIFEPCDLNIFLLLQCFVIFTSIPIKFILNEVPNISFMNELINLKGWLNPVLVFFVLYNLLDEKRHLRLAMLGIHIFFFVTVLSTIFVASGLFSIGKLKVVQEARSAGFGEANQYAAFLVLFLPLHFSNALLTDGNKKLLSIVIILLSFVSLLITGSRGGMISLFVTTMVYIYILSVRKMIRPGSIILLLAVGVPLFVSTAYTFAPAGVREMVIKRFDPSRYKNENEMTAGRTTLWRNGFLLFLKSPIYGHGQDTFIPLMKQKFPVWANSHNDYLLYLVHFGLIGLGIFIMVLWKLFRNSWWISKHAREATTRMNAISYFSGLSGFAVAMFGVNIMQPMYLFWAYSAIILKYGRLEDRIDMVK